MLIPTLIDARMGLLKSTLERRTQKINQTTFSPQVESIINFLLSSLIWFDTISCASTGSTPSLEINHLLALTTLGINMESLTGCRNPVVALIFEISLLDRWERASQNAHKLSIVDLAKHGQQIKERLRQELMYINHHISTRQILSLNSSGIPEVPTRTEFNKIFILSAITYLHVVIFRAHPELPEIAGSVSETIAVFKRLKNLKVLLYLVWPFCVSGCLALSEQQSFFKDLVSTAEISQYTLGTSSEAVKKVMEECWQSREAGLDACNWMSIMQKRGFYVLL